MRSGRDGFDEEGNDMTGNSSTILNQRRNEMGKF